MKHGGSPSAHLQDIAKVQHGKLGQTLSQASFMNVKGS